MTFRHLGHLDEFLFTVIVDREDHQRVNCYFMCFSVKGKMLVVTVFNIQLDI